jgi:hypothetical protein
MLHTEIKFNFFLSLSGVTRISLEALPSLQHASVAVVVAVA